LTAPSSGDLRWANRSEELADVERDDFRSLDVPDRAGPCRSTLHAANKLRWEGFDLETAAVLLARLA
jgi:hypothetical protein